MGYIFRLLFQSSSGPQDVDPDTQKFTALWGPKAYRIRCIHCKNI